MDNFKDLQNSWKGQKTSHVPDIAMIKKDIKKTRNKLVMKNISAIIALTATIIVLAMIGTYIQFEYLSSKIAIIGVIVTIALAIVFLVKLVNRMYKADDLQHSSKEYLQELKKFKVNQTSIQQKGIAAYFVAIIFFMYLYFYEIYHANSTIGICAYVSCTLWALFVWFYMRPRQIAKQEKQIDKMISEVERIEAQLE